MKRVLAAILVAQAAAAVAQPAWMPLSREVERPYAAALEAVGSDAHTAIRPYRRSDILALPIADSLRPAAALVVLDRWAGAGNGRKFRWGPLLDASAGYDMEREEPLTHRAGGGFWTDLDVGPKLSFHLDGQVWNERFPHYLDTLVRAIQVTPAGGYAYGTAPNYTHYDWSGHASWDPGKHFNLTLGRGRNSFGEGHRSLMLSDEAYSYPYLRITTSVWRVKYVNLFTAMDDIRGAGGDPGLFHRKYTSMHYLSWNAHKRINVALFEAVVWSAGDSLYPRGFDLNYVNPVIFYRPVEFSIGSPDNVLLGLGVNVKPVDGILVYLQLVLDEMLLKQVRSGNGWWGNKQSLQLGAVSRDAFNTPGLSLRAEWNFVRPFMYTHSDTRQNYTHFGQPLAHPYGSNLQEALVHADLVRGRWTTSLRTSMAWMGSDTLESFGNNIFRPENQRPRLPDGRFRNFGYRVGMTETVTLFHGELRAGWLLDPHTGTRLEASYLLRVRGLDGGGGETLTTNFFRLGLVCHFRERRHEQEVRYTLH